MIDPQSEKLLSFPQATIFLQSHPHICTLHRWRLRGITGIRLETVRIGGRRFTSREALERFNAAVTAAADGTPAQTRTPRRRQRDIARAEKELAEAGI
jgi:hypothetical protein